MPNEEEMRQHHEEHGGPGRHEGREEGCGCGEHHGHHEGPGHEEEMHRHCEEHMGPGHHEGRGEDCGCGGHHEEHHHGGMEHGGMPHEGCNCPWHMAGMMGGSAPMGMMGRMGMMGGFGISGIAPWRRFVSRDEIIARLDEYLKQLQAEETAVKERIDAIKKRGEQPEA